MTPLRKHLNALKKAAPKDYQRNTENLAAAVGIQRSSLMVLAHKKPGDNRLGAEKAMRMEIATDGQVRYDDVRTDGDEIVALIEQFLARRTLEKAAKQGRK